MINRVNHFLLKKIEPETLLREFLTMQVSGSILLVASSLLAPKMLPLTVAAFVITLSANGVIIANSNACFLKYFSKGAGTASAVLGAFQCVMGLRSVLLRPSLAWVSCNLL